MRHFYFTVLLIIASVSCFAGDSMVFSGQLSGWAQYNTQIHFPFWTGARYIPKLNYSINLPDGNMIDFEGSVNMNFTAAFKPPDDNYIDGYLKPYRLWARFSGKQFEIRAGLQKINFGSASMLRPLMWFDMIDPRDPLQLTNGVYGILGRYYFLNNMNLWLWVLYGNEKPKMYEIGGTSWKMPEFGGRFQSPVPAGEAGFSYHYRVADLRGIPGLPDYPEVPENRIGIDGKWDVGPGLWFEGAWIHKSRDIGIYTNEEIMNAGADYTFGIGNGLNLVFEQFMFSYDSQPFRFISPVTFSAVSLSYPVGLFDNLGAIFYYDWTHNSIYTYVSWKRQFRKFSMYVMAYHNPDQYLLPMQQETGTFFYGNGIQVMIVYDH